MNNSWELYDDHPDFAQANAEIEEAWEEAKVIRPSAPFQTRAAVAERHVYKVMEKWANVGAMDTEPVAELRWRVKKHFGVEGGYGMKPHGYFSVITPDEVAECWDGVFSFGNLYEQLWDCVKNYDNSHRANIEDIGPHDVIGINCVAQFWDSFSPENQAKLNELAVREDGPDDAE